MATESPVKDNIFQERIKEYKVLINEKNLISENEEFLKLKIQEADNEIEKLEKQRSDLESFIANAANLLLARKATTFDISNKRQELFCMHGALDDQKAVKDICLEKLAECPNSWRELRGRIQQKERELRNVRLQNIAHDVAKQCGKQLKEMAALVESLESHNFVTNHLGTREVNFLSLGALIVSGVYGGNIDNPNYPTRDEQELIRQEFNKEINA